MSDICDLLSRMADELDHYRQMLSDDRREVHALAAEARAVLSRWGTPNSEQIRSSLGAPPAPEPVMVPVAVDKRPPGDGDCDGDGKCWWWRTDDADEWWELLHIRDAWEHNAGCGNARYTHWLPAHAIPLPQVGEGDGVGDRLEQSALDKVVIHCPETCWIEIRRIADGKVIYSNYRKGDLRLPINEPPAEPPAPAGGLVERLANFLSFAEPLHLAESRAAIREVAEWLDDRGMHGCSLWLREEADRCP